MGIRISWSSQSISYFVSISYFNWLFPTSYLGTMTPLFTRYVWDTSYAFLNIS